MVPDQPSSRPPLPGQHEPASPPEESGRPGIPTGTNAPLPTPEAGNAPLPGPSEAPTGNPAPPLPTPTSTLPADFAPTHTPPAQPPLPTPDAGTGTNPLPRPPSLDAPLASAPTPSSPVAPVSPSSGHNTPALERKTPAHNLSSQPVASHPSRKPHQIGVLELLNAVVEHGGSDLHVPADAATKVRVDGRLRDLVIDGKRLIFDAQEVQRILFDILTQDQIMQFEEKHEIDLAYDFPGVARFRVNYYYAYGSVRGVFRLIPHEIKTLDELNLPPILRQLATIPRGLVLVTGPTGSGKSTTLAAMIDEINRSKEAHILTIEDPIEFVHQSQKCLVSQRELNSDTYSFANALKAALREDPDVILVGEMRDPETIELGLTAAETGHLVFATLHTQDASQTVDRIVDSFSPAQQGQIRAQLSLALQGIVTQQLVRRQDAGRAAACEILVVTSAVRNTLREGKSEQLYSIMQTSQKDGMQTMDAALAVLIKDKKISKQTAATISSNPGELDRLIASNLKVGNG